MPPDTNSNSCSKSWYAIKTPRHFETEKFFLSLGIEVFFPKQKIRSQSGHTRVKPVIPHVLFVLIDRQHIETLEQQTRKNESPAPRFWVYRNPGSQKMQPIGDDAIRLLRLLTADDPEKCQIFNKKDFKTNDHVRVTGGMFRGYSGYVQRVRKNRHVVVQIEGICAVLLPFIHPDLLEPIEPINAPDPCPTTEYHINE